MFCTEAYIKEAEKSLSSAFREKVFRGRQMTKIGKTTLPLLLCRSVQLTSDNAMLSTHIWVQTWLRNRRTPGYSCWASAWTWNQPSPLSLLASEGRGVLFSCDPGAQCYFLWSNFNLILQKGRVHLLVSRVSSGACTKCAVMSLKELFKYRINVST